MNRRQKIIISVTGIFIVMLILVGLTYAYFLTQITGNTKDKSISVTTANLQLTYGDGNGVLEVGDKLRPGRQVNFKTSSGTTVNEKTFTVTNSGDDTDYVVIVDNVNVTPEPFVSNDFIYTLTCTSSDDNKCDGTTDSVFPLKNQSILVGNKIAAGVTHTYTLTMEYKETGKNQSNDMGKSFTARINIEDIRRLDNPFEEGTLAYSIIDNSMNKTNGTELMSVPLSKVAEEISIYGTGKYENEILSIGGEGIYSLELLTYGETPEEANDGDNCIGDLGLYGNVEMCNAVRGQYISDGYCEYQCEYFGKVEDCTDTGAPIILKEITAPEETLSIAEDDYGTSYYYRGNVSDNYVTFADMCWRIVRIDGSGNTKLILEDQEQPCGEDINGYWAISTTTGGIIYEGNFGYTHYNKNTLTASDGTKNSNYLNLMDYLHGQKDSASSMATAFKNFQTNALKNKISEEYNNKKLEDYLVSGNWCLGDKAYDSSNNLLTSTQIMDNKIKSISFNYDSYQRLVGNYGYKPTFKCNGTVLEAFNDSTPMYVATITADEIVYAGGKYYGYNANFYLMNEEFKKGWYGTYKISNFFSLSPDSFNTYGSGTLYDSIVSLKSSGYLGASKVDDSYFRPSVSLKSGVEIISGGNGTKDNPYVIKQ